jgi:hypothetical protein
MSPLRRFISVLTTVLFVGSANSLSAWGLPSLQDVSENRPSQHRTHRVVEVKSGNQSQSPNTKAQTSATSENQKNPKSKISGGVLNQKALSLPKPAYPPIQ